MIGISLDIPEVAVRGGGLNWLPSAGGVVPTLFADFAADHYWFNGAAYSSFAAWNTAAGSTFARASNATYLQSGVIQTASSGAARFASAVSGARTGLRLTDAATNILLQSNAFTTTWASTSTPFTSAAGISPDGTNNAWSGNSASGATNQTTQTIAAAVTGSPQTQTLFAKQNTAATFGLGAFDNTGAAFIYQINVTWNGTSTPSIALGSGAGSTVVTQLANGWWRFDLTFTGTAGHALRFFLYPETGVPGTCTGKGNFFYGAGFYNLPYGPDYIPTTTASASQVADAFTFPWNTTTGSIIVKLQNINFVTNSTIVGNSSTTDAPLFESTNSPAAVGSNNTVTSLTKTGAGVWDGALRRVGVAGNNAGRSLTIDGNTVATDANALVSGTFASLGLSNSGGAVAIAPADYATLAVWASTKIADADLVRLTT